MSRPSASLITALLLAAACGGSSIAERESGSGAPDGGNEPRGGSSAGSPGGGGQGGGLTSGMSSGGSDSVGGSMVDPGGSNSGGGTAGFGGDGGASGTMDGAGGCNPWTTVITNPPECPGAGPSTGESTLVAPCEMGLVCNYLPGGVLPGCQPLQPVSYVCCGWGFTRAWVGPDPANNCPTLAPNGDERCELPIEPGLACSDQGLTCAVLAPRATESQAFVCCEEQWQSGAAC